MLDKLKLTNPRIQDLTGQTFNRLTALKIVGRNKQGRLVWQCRCSCGNITEVSANHLKNGHTKSCGCLKLEVNTKQITDFNKKKGLFIKEEHTEEEIEEHEKYIKSRYNDFKWVKLSKELRKNAKCFICGSSKKLQAHHKNDYRKYPEQRYDKNNIVILCNSCHNKYHGKHKATEEEWEAYIKEECINVRYNIQRRRAC